MDASGYSGEQGGVVRCDCESLSYVTLSSQEGAAAGRKRATGGGGRGVGKGVGGGLSELDLVVIRIIRFNIRFGLIRGLEGFIGAKG